MWLLLAFVAVPLIEIALFIQVGGLIGLWPTLFLVLLTAVAGTVMVRMQGRQAMMGLQTAFAQLDDPTEALMHGAMVLIAGVLLLTPGFFTDAMGLALLVPAIRTAVFHRIRARVATTRFQMGPQPHRHDPFREARHPAHRPDIIDGEFHEIDPEKRPTHRPSGWTRH